MLKSKMSKSPANLAVFGQLSSIAYSLPVEAFGWESAKNSNFVLDKLILPNYSVGG